MMDTVTIIIIVLVVLFFASRMMPVKGVTNITPQQAKAKFKDKNVQFIDVRTPGEYRANHRKPFKNIPLANLASEINKLDKEKEIVVICQSGMRSKQAAKLLKRHGFQKIYNVQGGMSAFYR